MQAIRKNAKNSGKTTPSEPEHRKIARSAHEKMRRSEFNAVVNEIRDLIPEPKSANFHSTSSEIQEADSKDAFTKKKLKWDKCQILEAAVRFVNEQKDDDRQGSSLPLEDFIIQSYVNLFEIVILKLDKNWKILELAFDENLENIFGVEKDDLMDRTVFTIFDFKSAMLLRSLALTKNPMLRAILTTNAGTKCTFYCYKSQTDCWFASISVLRKDDFGFTHFEEDQPIDLSSKISDHRPPTSSPNLEEKLDELTNNDYISKRPILASLLMGKKSAEAETQSENGKIPWRNSESASTSATNSSNELASQERKRAATISNENDLKFANFKKRKFVESSKQIRRSTAVIVETFPLLEQKDNEIGSKPTRTHKSTISGVRPPFPIEISHPSATPIVPSPTDYLEPVYREIYLRLDRERQELERRVLEKTREVAQFELIMKQANISCEPKARSSGHKHSRISSNSVIISPIPTIPSLSLPAFPSFPTPSPSAVDVLSPVSGTTNLTSSNGG